MPQKILIIDDEKLIRWALEQHLVKQGYQVATAESAEQGLVLLTEDAPDLILLDNCLPDMTGIQLLEQLHVREQKFKVIMITAYDMAENSVNAMNLGAYEYISKPFNLEELTALIHKTLNTEHPGPG
jgi:two-component system, NtrC family, response regulator AtoC